MSATASLTKSQLLGYKGLDLINRISAERVGDRMLSQEEVTHILKAADAFWLHSGDPAHPHARLTQGQCSNGFINVMKALVFTNVCDMFGLQLANLLTHPDRFGYYQQKNPEDPRVDWVVGSDHAAITLSFATAKYLFARNDSTEKITDPDKKLQVWRRHDIQPGEGVLQVEELITTTKTLEAVRTALRRDNPSQPISFVPAVMTIVHRSSVWSFEGGPILYLAHYDIETWEPDQCPLCQAGSRALRPKEVPEWEELKATGRQ